MPARLLRHLALSALAAAVLAAPGFTDGAAAAERDRAPVLAAEAAGSVLLAQRRTCRSARSCQEAVAMWCGGYRRADGDGDGIPCENVCFSRRQVQEIRRAIGC